MKFISVGTAETLGIKEVINTSMGMYLVLDHQDREPSAKVLLVPFMWDHRRLIDRSELEASSSV